MSPARFCNIVLGWARKRILSGANPEQRLEQWMMELEMPLPGDTRVTADPTDEDLAADGESFLAMFGS